MPKAGTKHPMGISPIGEALYVWLDKPRPPFDDRKDREPRYEITLAFDKDDPKVIEWIKGIKALTKYQKLPWKVNAEDDRLHVKFASAYKPVFRDAQNAPLPEGVTPGSGSMVRVAYVPNEYPGFGGGLNLYLNGVQVIEMVEHKMAVDFPTSDGYTASEEPEKKEPTQDDMPF